ncbi:glycosyltransferase family 4 protein [Porphyromonas catoniae]|jgi:glycosyltransferase|uniref:glycosyltransferase family 4 protein n=1 Tax=Porphyromonas catoniae TaxID=41976 RepID=UPI0023F4A56E|nr:glycosyltransferase family 4 protein [Porphyromonas catoniae]
MAHRRINVILMDMSHEYTTSGVDRYMDVLVAGLAVQPEVCLVWLHLVDNQDFIAHRVEVYEGYTKVIYPLPVQYEEIILERYWIDQYNREIYRLAKPILCGFSPCIIHLHTLNLISLATCLRNYLGGKIITHLHCIPWKGYLNSNPRRFSELYHKYYLSRCKIDPKMFFTHPGELESYTEVDHIICVTRCARVFLERVSRPKTPPISIINNGLMDKKISYSNVSRFESNVFHLLYVGVVNPSKGLDYILQAMLLVQKLGYNLKLSVAGDIAYLERNRIRASYPNLQVDLLGCISFQELCTLYQRVDCGVIASLQEQCSYVAIEMCMFGLPIITTAVDGLDEIFTHELNALKVKTRFSRPLGLCVDVENLAGQIICLAKDAALRKQLGDNARQLYLANFSVEQMIQQTLSIYLTI